MHALIVAFYALVFSFGHSTAPREVVVPLADASPTAVFAPTRQELVHAELLESGYAGSACVSCRRTDVSYRVR